MIRDSLHKLDARSSLQFTRTICSICLLRKPPRPLSKGLVSDLTSCSKSIESGTFTTESPAETEARVARGTLAELERRTRLEAIAGSLSTAEVGKQVGIDAASVRHS